MAECDKLNSEATGTLIEDSVPFSFRSPRTKKRISASDSRIPQLKVDPKTVTVNEKVTEEDEDDSILLSRYKRRKTKGVNSPTPMSPGKQGQIAESRENIEADEDLSMVPMTDVSNDETPVQCASPISRSSMLLETTTEPLMVEYVDNAPLNVPNNFNLNEALNQHNNENSSIIRQRTHEDMEAPDSVKALGKLSVRIEHLLKGLSHAPSPSISPLASKKASLLDTLAQLANNPESFDSFTDLLGVAQQFTELAPASFQSTMDHLIKSIRSIQELSSKLKNQGPQILSSLKKKPELTASMERLRLEVEKKVEGVQTLRKTHSDKSTKIEFLEAELVKLEREREAIEGQLADADNELNSLSYLLDDLLTALENEADRLVRAESMRTSWDRDMKVFISAIVGIIEQLRSL